MAKYKTHSAFNIIFVLPISIFILTHYLNVDTQNLFFYGMAFIYSTLFMNPDMDLAKKIKTFSIRGILTLPFKLYSQIFRHRGISHTFPFGTISRIIFLLLFIVFILFLTKTLFFFSTETYKTFFLENRVMLFYLFLGICIADISHLFLDLKDYKL